MNQSHTNRAPKARLLFLAIVAMIGWFPSTDAFAMTEKMRFSLRPPEQPIAIFGSAWTIYAEGEIDADAAGRLQALIDQNRIPSRSTIYLNSPGGSLVGGIQLGRIIRGAGLFTHVGVERARDFMSAPGECFSACALAFLGGEFRWIGDASKYGVHRFSSEMKTDRDSDIAQMMSSIVVNYIGEMGVNTDLFREMSFTGSNNINVLSIERLVKLNVVNNGEGPTAWTVESMPEGIYLKGERYTWRGVNKFIIACMGSRDVFVYVVFDAENRGDELVSMRAISLFLDGDAVPISEDLKELPQVKNGWLNAFINLDRNMLSRIERANTVGVAFQYSYEAPMFFGFQGMDFQPAREKLAGMLKVCLN